MRLLVGGGFAGKETSAGRVSVQCSGFGRVGVRSQRYGANRRVTMRPWCGLFRCEEVRGGVWGGPAAAALQCFDLAKDQYYYTSVATGYLVQ